MDGIPCKCGCGQIVTSKRRDGTFREWRVGALKVRSPFKHRYCLPLDEGMQERIAPLARPYPKRHDG